MTADQPATTGLLTALAEAAAHLEGERIGEAAAALDRAAQSCGALQAAGDKPPADLVAQARALHDRCGVLVRAVEIRLTSELQTAGASRVALRGYRKAGRR
ncbi:MAG: hypothetical protein ABUS79_26785 [Pseudomonadota bacterium]